MKCKHIFNRKLESGAKVCTQCGISNIMFNWIVTKRLQGVLVRRKVV